MTLKYSLFVIDVGGNPFLEKNNFNFSFLSASSNYIFQSFIFIQKKAYLSNMRDFWDNCGKERLFKCTQGPWMADKSNASF